MFNRISTFWKLCLSLILIIIVILIGLSYVNSHISNSNLRILITVFTAIVLSVGATWFFVRIFITRPTKDLVDGMKRLAAGELDYRINENLAGEFNAAAVSFNEMAAMLAESLMELRKTRDYLRSILRRSANVIGILESTADIIITVNSAGIIETVNSGAEKALGYERNEVVGQPIEMLFVDPHERELAIDQLKSTDNVVNYETRFLTKDKRVREVLLTLSRLRNRDGAAIGTIGISKDVTREKRMQNQLIQSQRLAAIGQVFTSIQHSMKNMLNACKGGSYMVKIGLKKDDRAMLEEGWGMVEEGISRMTDMSANMLKYVKEWKPHYQAVDLKKVLSDIGGVITQTARDKGITFKLSVTPELPSLSCDSGMIHSAVMDIVSNALDACTWKEYKKGEIPEVKLSAYTSGDGSEMCIEIKDNGCGMTEEVRRSIFIPFFSTKSKAGTGLGLSITSRIIEVHGGAIYVDSEPNAGTIFRIVLPARQR